MCILMWASWFIKIDHKGSNMVHYKCSFCYITNMSNGRGGMCMASVVVKPFLSEINWDRKQMSLCC